MVTLSILKYLQDEGFGTIDLDGSIKTNGLYLEKLTQDKKSGIAIYSRGFPLSRGSRKAMVCDLYARGTDDVWGPNKLQKIQQMFIERYDTTCDLEALPPITTQAYRNVIINPVGNIENAGLDANDRVIYTMSIQVIYNEV